MFTWVAGTGLKPKLWSAEAEEENFSYKHLMRSWTTVPAIWVCYVLTEWIRYVDHAKSTRPKKAIYFQTGAKITTFFVSISQHALLVVPFAIYETINSDIQCKSYLEIKRK